MPEKGEILGRLTVRLGGVVRERYPHRMRAARTIKLLRERVYRAFKIPREASVLIHPELNELVWRRGAGNPPRKISVEVRVTKYKEGEKEGEEPEEVLVLPVRPVKGG